MTTSIRFGATYGATTLPNTNEHDAATTQTFADGDGVRVSKADGLRGALGLYEVTTGSGTHFVTQDELDKMAPIASRAPGGAATAMLSGSVTKKENDTTSGTIKNMG
jgi:hypothetical protein